MIRKRSAGHRTQAVRANRHSPGMRALVFGLALAVAISCGSGGWRCEVTIVMDGRTVVGTGSGNARDVAAATALTDACEQLGLDTSGMRRCVQRLQPASAESWSLTEDCEET